MADITKYTERVQDGIAEYKSIFSLKGVETELVVCNIHFSLDCMSLDEIELSSYFVEILLEENNTDKIQWKFAKIEGEYLFYVRVDEELRKGFANYICDKKEKYAPVLDKILPDSKDDKEWFDKELKLYKTCECLCGQDGGYSTGIISELLFLINKNKRKIDYYYLLGEILCCHDANMRYKFLLDMSKYLEQIIDKQEKKEFCNAVLKFYEGLDRLKECVENEDFSDVARLRELFDVSVYLRELRLQNRNPSSVKEVYQPEFKKKMKVVVEGEKTEKSSRIKKRRKLGGQKENELYELFRKESKGT